MKTYTSQHGIVRQVMWVGCLAAIALGAGGCISIGSMKPGQMDWVQPTGTQAPRVGTVYLMRGWVGMFSVGMDHLSEKIEKDGVTAHVFQHDQCQELADTMAKRYKASKTPEPICLIGHSFGADDALVIARKLEQVGVPVDMVVTMDPVDQSEVPKNVKVCYNYYQPGIFAGTNFLRGIPLKQEPGGSGKLYNINLLEDGRNLREWYTNHVNIDDTPKVHQDVLAHLLTICPERATWLAMHGGGGQRDTGLASTPVIGEDAARTAGGKIGPAAAAPAQKQSPSAANADVPRRLSDRP